MRKRLADILHTVDPDLNIVSGHKRHSKERNRDCDCEEGGELNAAISIDDTWERASGSECFLCNKEVFRVHKICTACARALEDVRKELKAIIDGHVDYIQDGSGGGGDADTIKRRWDKARKNAERARCVGQTKSLALSRDQKERVMRQEEYWRGKKDAYEEIMNGKEADIE